MEKVDIAERDIINSAKKLMQQYGLKKTTMDDIAKAAVKSKSTLYYYFKDKEDILQGNQSGNGRVFSNGKNCRE
jgi:AcrR family transcriptional regulator